jgi:S-adenosylmethionine:diacylglycerol 3-amino-3-carboxypropyl transferase
MEAIAMPIEVQPQWQRSACGTSKAQRLFFSQLREDPQLEIEALQPSADRRFVVISSGGCTALSLLGAGAGQVVSVDLNQTQNHLLEIKMAAICYLPPEEVLPFLGAAPALHAFRRHRFLGFQQALSAGARAYWNRHLKSVENGVLSAGVTEKVIRLLVRLCQRLVHRRATLHELLAQPNLRAQHDFYQRVWNNRRWRMLFRLFYGRKTMSLTYAPGFYARAQNAAFGGGMRDLVEYGLTQVPIQSNYFAFHNLTGFYKAHDDDALPPYLTQASMRRIREATTGLQIVDGSMTAYLQSCPPGSVDGVALSNICEWLSEEQVVDLFAQLLRVCKPGATVCFRHHMGWTEIPQRFRAMFVENEALSHELIARDRSMVQRGITICQLQAQVDVDRTMQEPRCGVVP